MQHPTPEATPSACPFCGTTGEWYSCLHGGWEIFCPNDDCMNVSTLAGQTPEQALAQWNRRNPEKHAT